MGFSRQEYWSGLSLAGHSFPTDLRLVSVMFLSPGPSAIPDKKSKCSVQSTDLYLILTTQRDGMGREEGGGFRMGNKCIPVVDSF